MSGDEQRMRFSERLTEAVQRCGTPVLVGLDPRFDLLPAGLRSGREPGDRSAAADAYLLFCRGVLDVVQGLVAAVKPQLAFFEQLGPPGMRVLAEVIDHARRCNLLVVLDGKRNDIGSTAAAYADAYLGEQSVWRADALTVNPYLGNDSLDPFVEAASMRQAGLFVLVKTSNPGARQLQDLNADGKPVYRHVAEYLAELSQRTAGRSGYGDVGAVVGATYPEQLAELRGVMPSAWLLVPGFGAQGARPRDVAAAFDTNGLGALVNSSRGIIFAHARDAYRQSYGDAKWQEAVEAATREMIQQLREETPAGALVP